MKKAFWIIIVISSSLLSSSCKETPCDGVDCLNGTCIEALGTCECLPGYEGTDCGTESRSKFLGTFQVQYEGCFSTSPNHTVGIEQITGDLMRVYVYDLGDYECPGGEGRIKLEAEIDTTQLRIPQQTIDCGAIAYTFAGGGNLEGSILRLTFTVNYDADGIKREDSCTARLEK